MGVKQWERGEKITLKVIILNKEIFPPEADMTYESFFESAKHDTASSGFVSPKSFVMIIPLGGCHNCGAILAVACKDRKSHLIRFRQSQESGIPRSRDGNTLPRSFLGHFHSLCTALDASARIAKPEFV